jgi:thiol-disulfide isomerase/thioredoxin
VKLFLLILIIFISLITPACREQKLKDEKTEPASRTGIEKVRLTSLNGQVVDLNNYKTKTVFINFWATWCKPCIEEMPTIKNAMNSFKGKNIEFLFASDETRDEIQRFEAAHDYNLNYLIAGNMEELNIMGLPTTFIFNKNGKLVFSEMGYRKWDNPANIDLIKKITDQE